MSAVAIVRGASSVPDARRITTAAVAVATPPTSTAMTQVPCHGASTSANARCATSSFIISRSALRQLLDCRDSMGFTLKIASFGSVAHRREIRLPCT